MLERNIFKMLLILVGISFVQSQSSTCSDLPRMTYMCSFYRTYCFNTLYEAYMRTHCSGTCPNLCISNNQGAWSNWNIGNCDVQCGNGKRVDRRRCLTQNCVGQETRQIDCKQPPCFRAIRWGNWSFGPCSVSCGIGTRRDTRRCLTGNDCIGESTRVQPCILPACSPRTVCTDKLNFCRLYVNYCNDQSLTDFLTINCPETCPQLCNSTEQNPNQNEYGPWINQGTCSVTCGLGSQRQVRSCLNGFCQSADLVRFISCQARPCMGVWGAWQPWTLCDRTCGSGVQFRRRDCSTSLCLGNVNSISRSCNNKNCRRTNNCRRTCGNGTALNPITNQYRDCYNGPCETQNCPAPWKAYYGWRSHECCDATNFQATSCGITSNIGRIIGGMPATITAWPWMVQIRTSSSFCGGMLISPNFVLTAAHCLFNQRMVSMVIGIGQRADFVTNRSAEEVIIHEQYSLNTFENDIALIRFITPVNIASATTRSICLPEGEIVPEDLECVVAGWGFTSNSGTPQNRDLNVVGVRILPIEICQRAYRIVNPNLMLCAGRVDGAIDSCAGDSGGPLMCQRCSTCEWMVVGITSFGGALCATQNEPGVYTRVVNLESWLYPKLGLTQPVQRKPACS